MRVISGKCRGTKLMAPEGSHTRPTIDRIKETLFNIIAFDLPGCDFLDLFSGSGAIGIESLSRGARQAVFVENNSLAIECIKKNLAKTGLTHEAIVYNQEIYSALKDLVSKKLEFDIIFLDPPYHMENLEGILDYIAQNKLLKPEGYIILERDTTRELKAIKGLNIFKEKKYKTTTMSFFERID